MSLHSRRFLQGATFVALCFFTLSAGATTYCRVNQATALESCTSDGGTCDILYGPTNTSVCSDGNPAGYSNSAWYRYSTHYYYFIVTNPYWPATLTEESDYDSNQCFSAYGEQICPDNPEWYDHNGYDADGCYKEGQDDICPSDDGWQDPEGYDSEGFDSGGIDRGGFTASQGGGYWGSAGTGGMPPAYIETPYPIDPAAGNNRDGSNILRCTFAYPITIDKASVPGPVLDGLGACLNECQYSVFTTLYDFDIAAELVQLTPTGSVCSGSDSSMGTIGVDTYVEPPSGEEPANELDNLNFCYNNGGYLFCDSFNDQNPPECYLYQAGWTGQEIDCRDLSEGGGEISCGVFNGVYHCLDQSSNCESFNGTIQCVDDNGNVVDQDSPDHIINGGNGDGNNSNDVFADSTDVQNNGQTTQERIIQTLDGRELARQIDSQLSDNFSDLESAISSGFAELNDGDSTDGQSSLSGLTGNIGMVGTDGDLSFDSGIADGLRGTVEGILPSGGSCSVFNFDLLPEYGMSISVDTCDIALLRTFLEWMLYAMTVITLFNLVVRQKAET